MTDSPDPRTTEAVMRLLASRSPLSLTALRPARAAIPLVQPVQPFQAAVTFPTPHVTIPRPAPVRRQDFSWLSRGIAPGTGLSVLNRGLAGENATLQNEIDKIFKGAW